MDIVVPFIGELLFWIVLGVAIVGTFVFRLLPYLFVPVGTLFGVLLLAGLALALAQRWRTHRALARFVQTYRLPDRLPYCLECNYNLKGSTSDTCPECGAEVTTNREPHG